MKQILQLLGFIGLSFIVFANGFRWESFLMILLLPLFFLGKPWYTYLTKK
ncbi:hypothetical protein ACIQZG_05325 [Lysinibacillus sp. NPDC096418]